MTTARTTATSQGATIPDAVLMGYIVVVMALLVAWPFKHVSQGGDHYVFLARSFAEGTLHIDTIPAFYSDFVPFHGHKYLPFGPLPGLILIPFLPLIDAGVPMLVVGYLLTVVCILAFYRILGRIGVEGDRRNWTTLLYFAGTVYLSVTLVGISTYLAHIVVTVFLLLAVLETLGTRRLMLIGFLIGLAAGARATALCSLPFFLWMIVRPAAEGERSFPEGRRKLIQVGLVLIGLAIPLGALLLYNSARFGNPLETGFGMADLYHDSLFEARSRGLFSIAHVPKNVAMLFFKGPDLVGGDYSPVLTFPFLSPSPWGMGIFFTSPALLYIFRAPLKDRLVQASCLGVLTTLPPLLLYYGVGYVQFGYRYSLDFMPFLMLVAARGLPEPLTQRARLLIGASVLINVWGAAHLARWL